MRYLIILILLVIAVRPVAAQSPAAPPTRTPLDAISNYFSEYVDDERFTAVYVSGKMFELFNDAKIDLEEIDDEELAAIMEVVRDVKGIRVLHTDITPQRFYDQANARISTDAYELLFKVRTQDGEQVEAFIQNEEAIVNELFMLVGTDTSFAMLSFIGNIDLSKLAGLQRALDN